MPKKRFSLTRELKKLSKPQSAAGRAKLKALFGAEVGGDRPACWPWTSYGMGVHPDQVAEANAMHKAAGTGCHHGKDGRLVAPDAASRKRALKLRGMTDLSGFC